MCEAMMVYLITYKYQEVTSFHFEVLQTRFGVNKLNKRVCFSERTPNDPSLTVQLTDVAHTPFQGFPDHVGNGQCGMELNVTRA